MTKKVQYQNLRSMFFQLVTERYPEMEVDSDGGGRWQMYIEDDCYELGSLNYGGEVIGYMSSTNKRVKEVEEELNTLLETVFNMFPDLK